MIIQYYSWDSIYIYIYTGWWFGCHEFYFPRNIGNFCHHPNWRTPSFFRTGWGKTTTKQKSRVLNHPPSFWCQRVNTIQLDLWHQRGPLSDVWDRPVGFHTGWFHGDGPMMESYGHPMMVLYGFFYARWCPRSESRSVGEQFCPMSIWVIGDISN